MGTWINVSFENARIAPASFPALRKLLEIDDTADLVEEATATFGNSDGYDEITVEDDGTLDISDVYFNDSTSWGHASLLADVINVCEPGAVAYVRSEDDDEPCAYVKRADGSVTSHPSLLIFEGADAPAALPLATAEGVTWSPIVRTEPGGIGSGLLGRIEVGLRAVFPDCTEHTVLLVPSTATDEGPGTGNVFLYEDDDPITHLAWSHPPQRPADE